LPVKENLINIAAVLCSAVIAVGVYLAIWSVRALIEGRFFPPQRERRVPWTGLQLIALLLLIEIFWPSVIYWTLKQLQPGGFSPPAAAVTDSVPEGEDGGDRGGSAANSTEGERKQLWIAVFTFPFQVATIILFLIGVSRARLADMGLTTRYFGSNIVISIIGWIVLAPAVLFLNLLINLVYRRLFHLHEEEHPIMRLMLAGPSTLEIVLVAFTAIVAAPVFEELLFRGVLQPWFAKSNFRGVHIGGIIALAAAVALATVSRHGKILDAMHSDGILAALQEGMAVGFVLLMIPGYFVARLIGRALSAYGASGSSSASSAHSRADNHGGAPLPSPMTMDRRLQLRETKAMNQAGAIYAASLLFAAAHSFAWPTPISLFILALGLGYLVYRMQSIVVSITLHALFNSISVVALLVAPQLVKGNDATSAAPVRPSIVHSSTVPGS
jgi:membrane protease YdiL (CAAX protease family)